MANHRHKPATRIAWLLPEAKNDLLQSGAFNSVVQCELDLGLSFRVARSATTAAYWHLAYDTRQIESTVF